MNIKTKCHYAAALATMLLSGATAVHAGESCGPAMHHQSALEASSSGTGSFPALIGWMFGDAHAAASSSLLGPASAPAEPPYVDEDYLNCAGFSGVFPGGSDSDDVSGIASGVSLVNGAISRNIYRIPYAGSSTSVMGAGDYFDHGGSMDIRNNSRVCTGNLSLSCTTSLTCAVANAGTCQYVMVAPAPGRVCTVIEHFDDCGSAGGYGNFGNVVVILHANGEASRFLHVRQWSASQFGISVGDFVNTGQPIAIDGDVGRSQGGQSTSCGEDGPPRFGTCLTSVPAGSTNCFRHSHWNVIRYRTGEVLNPFTCGIPGNRYQSGQSYTQVACGTTPGNYATSSGFSGLVYSGFGVTSIVQRHTSITASTVSVQNQGSLVYHAGNRVTLTPGFRVGAGAYFRAEVGSAPDLTAPGHGGLGVPGSCPCDNAQGFCVQWSDLTHPDRVRHGCATPGPTFGSCHGCTIGGRCCPCQGAGNCQTDGSCN